MGITGLIPFLEKASSKVNLRDIKGYTVAIDTYCWLHKGVFSCAEKLARGEETDLYIQYCLKYVNLLLSYDIKPILVFDGRHLPAKALTEHRRRESREQSKKRAAELLRLGKTDEARSHMRRCIDVTHEMALKLIQECRQRNVDCIVAPYEADAQLAYLNKLNVAQFVITEDSDLVLFGCKKIIFKLDLVGNGLLVEADKLYLPMGCHKEKYTFDKFRIMCILSGCDYLDSLPGIGLAKACKFVMKTEETDLQRALLKIPQYLNMRQLTVTTEYIESFLKAEATFKHMYVFDPLKRKMVRLNALTDFGTAPEYCVNAGSELDEDVAFQLALGNLNPFSLKVIDDWNPDYTNTSVKVFKNSRSFKTTKHSSIWQPNFKTHNPETRKNGDHVDIRCALQFKKVNCVVDVKSETELEYCSQDEDDIAAIYTDNGPPPKRLCQPQPRQKERPPLVAPVPEEDLKRRNPFIKSPANRKMESPFRNQSDSLLALFSPERKAQVESAAANRLQKLSKLKRSLFDPPSEVKPEVKSRFFASNAKVIKEEPDQNTPEKREEQKSNLFNILSPSQINQTVTQDENLEKQVTEIENAHRKTIERTMALYSMLEDSPSPERTKTEISVKSEFSCTSGDSGIGSFSSHVKLEEDVIELSDTECKLTKFESASTIKPKLGSRKPVPSKSLPKSRGVGLSKPKNSKGITVPANQSRLSMFGFQKRPSLK